ncbi:uncharacterized protein LOC132736586 [Ruditapes philippinarum]|uniref:uncharacterized protein LOC132736586 n=1 Tax=Ruditapes philippinarum TaxID=129788 RepID=UPI00295C0DB8|nr:uncharacterized protein LOC132736586 [Ruditapes philippinarum]
MRMAKFQTCSSRYLLLGAGIVIMTLLGAAVSQGTTPNESPPCNQEEDAFERRTLEDGASSIILNRQNNFKAEETGEIGQAAADQVLKDLTPEKIAAQLTGAAEMDSISTAVNKARLAKTSDLSM